MHKKIKLGLFVFIIIGVVILNFTYKNKNEETKTKKGKQNNLAIMIKGDSGEYVSSNEIPKGNYVLNEEKTICENGGKVVSYNNSTGQIGFSFLGSDRCSLYFDKIIDTQKPVISNLNVNYTTVTAVLTDDKGLSSYGISSSNTIEPTNWTSISGTSYNLSTTITTEGTYYLWVKDGAENKTTKEFTISLEIPITTLLSTSTPDVYIENGIRYEGADPKNYICLDNKTSGTCSDNSLLFRIIGLFDEDTSSDGTSSSGTKKLLKVIDTNNYGGKEWNSSAFTNDWSTASLKTELNGTYLTTLLGTSNVNGKLSSGIANAKWHLGGANKISESKYNGFHITTENYYKAERSPYATSGTLQNLYSGNPEYVFAKVGLMYPSDYGYASVGGSTTSKENCRAQALYDWSSYSDCKNNDWLYKSQSISWGSNKNEWLISPPASSSSGTSVLRQGGSVDADNCVFCYQYEVRPTFYLDSSILKIVGGLGTNDNAYRIG
ncbi:MAG: hypothetical protein PUA55_05185 [Mycoplasma sp.]|nr:hypothetical protein [Mycoplasma sp.]